MLRDDSKCIRLADVRIEGTDDDMRLFFRNARGHPTLEEFHLKNVTTADPHVTLDLILSTLLVSAPRIHTVHIENTSIEASSIAAISYCSTMRSLTLRKNGYTDADALVLADALLSSLSPLHTLDLSSNDLSDVGVDYLERLLEKNTTIRTLSLNDNKNITCDISAKILVGRAATAA